MLTGSCLVLNASFEPLRVVSVFRAVCMIAEEKCDVVEEVEGKVVRSPSVTFPWPSVVKLRKYVKIPFKAKSALNTKTVLARDKHECAYCGGRATTTDHIQPRSRGGKHIWQNVIASCRPCNARKDNKTLAELGWDLRFQPTMPASKYWLIISWDNRKRWEPYLQMA